MPRSKNNVGIPQAQLAAGIPSMSKVNVHISPTSPLAARTMPCDPFHIVNGTLSSPTTRVVKQNQKAPPAASASLGLHLERPARNTATTLYISLLQNRFQSPFLAQRRQAHKQVQKHQTELARKKVKRVRETIVQWEKWWPRGSLRAPTSCHAFNEGQWLCAR